MISSRFASTPRPGASPVLLCDAGFYGTLAATRVLGREGVAVTIADPGRMGVAAWSKYATRVVRAPAANDFDPFVAWLLDFGARSERHALCPTSDDVTFAVARHREALSRHYFVDVPDLDAILNVLDKRDLYRLARDAGFDVPDTWFPESFADLDRVAGEVPMPVLIKPRTQVLYRSRSKGAVVDTRGELQASYRRFVAQHTHERAIVDLRPAVAWPMLQSFHRAAAESIRVVAGYYDVAHDRVLAVSARKVLQRPRNLGIGLCFEHAPTDEATIERARQLCKRSGYFGLFQLELIQTEGRELLIDFNPRFYNQLALDAARGLPLPQLAYCAAVGDRASFDAHFARAASTERDRKVFCNRFGMEVLVRSQRASGAMSARDAAGWQRWAADHRDALVDPVADANDPLPIAADVTGMLLSALKHPRSFLRTMVLNR